MGLFDRFRRQPPAQASHSADPATAPAGDVLDEANPQTGDGFSPQTDLGSSAAPAQDVPEDILPQGADFSDDNVPAPDSSTLLEIAEMHSTEMSPIGSAGDELSSDAADIADDLDVPEI